MRVVSAAALIAASPQAVWDLYADVAGSVDWVPFVVDVVYISGPAGLGQVYRERTRLGGLTTVSDWEVVEWDPPRRQVQLSRAFGMVSRLIIEVQADPDEGSLVLQSTELRSRLPGPFGRLHEAVLGRVAAKGLREAVSAAKRHLEHRR